MARFRDLYQDTQAKLFRRNILVAAFVYVAFVCWDVIVAPMSLGNILEIRLVFLGLGMLLFLASGLASFRRWYNWCVLGLIGSVGLSVAVILSLVPRGFAIGIAGVLICISASSVLVSAEGWATARSQRSAPSPS